MRPDEKGCSPKPTFPDDKEAWYGYGEALFHDPGAPRRDQAQEAFERAVQLDPSFHLPYQHIFDVMWVEQRYDEALDRADALIREDPRNPLWHRYRAETLAFTTPEEDLDTLVEAALRHQVTPADRRELYKDVATRVSSRGLITKTEDYLEKALVADPEHDDPGILRGLMSLLRGQAKWDQYEEWVRKGLEQRPENTVLLRDLFAVHDAKRRYAEALIQARRLTRENPDDLQWSRLWVRYAVFSGDEYAIQAAVRTAQEAARSADDRRALYGTLGHAYAAVGDMNRAVDFFRQQLAVEPERELPFIYRDLAAWETRRGRYDAARRWFERALEADARDVGALRGLAILAREQRDNETLQRMVKQMLELIPPGAGGHVPAILHVWNGELEKAEAIYEAQLARPEPEWRKWQMLIDIGWNCLVAGYMEHATDLFGRAAALDNSRRNPSAHMALGLCHLIQGDYEQAETALEAAMNVEYPEQNPTLVMAACKVLLGDPDEAERLTRAALRILPDAMTRGTLGLIHMLQERYEEALPIAVESVALDSTRASHEFLAWVLIAGDIDIERGMQEARVALALPMSASEIGPKLPFWPLADHSVGLAYLKKGQPELAVPHLRRATELLPARMSARADLQRAESELAHVP
jgi:tetratricopeptide (TPR) repeat protein